MSDNDRGNANVGKLANYLVQSTSAQDWSRAAFEWYKKGYIEIAPGVLQSPDGKTTVEL